LICTKILYILQPSFGGEPPKKQYKEIKYGDHLVTMARGLLGSTLFGTIFTLGLHRYNGMIVGLAMQCVMGPFNLFENPLAKAVLFGRNLHPSSKIFDEKTADELTKDDEVVDAEGNVVKRKKAKKSLEEVLLDTWDDSHEADISKLMSMLDKKNINTKTKENGWTPIMVMAAIGVKSTTSAMRQMKELGADPSITDNEGWNALHWAAFHGSLDGAMFLLSKNGFNAAHLHTVKDKEGNVPLDHAKSGNHTTIVEAIELAVQPQSQQEETIPVVEAQQEGLRKRK
jgi:hypothetical protein